MKFSKLGFTLYFLIFSTACENNTVTAENINTNPTIIYDATLYQNKPDFSSLGIHYLDILYTKDLWPENADMVEPNKTTILNSLTEKINNKVSQICIDIEHWPVNDASSDKFAESIRKYRLVSEWAHNAFPTLKIGYYSVIPQRNYWTPINNDPQEILLWENTNSKLTPIANVVDIIFPSLYTFHYNPDEWVTYAIANIKEAKKYGKPVYAFIWPQFHDSNILLGGQYIPGEFWRLQLETVYQYADAIIIWGGNNQEWDENAPWWQETKLFLAEHSKNSAASSSLEITSSNSPK